MDLENFFDRVNHDILMAKLAKRIRDKRVLRLIRKYLQAGVMINGCRVATEEGTPQGGQDPLWVSILVNHVANQTVMKGSFRA
jgi:RNA-directed DNA polymerase